MKRLFVLGVLLAACGPGPGTSPEATFASYLKLAQANDMRGVMSLMDPDRLPMLVLGVLGGASRMAASPSTDPRFKEEYAALQKKYGLGDPQTAIGGAPSRQDFERAAREFLRNVSDLPALTAELYHLLSRYQSGGAPPVEFKGTLTGVKIIDDTASGVLTRPDGTTLPMNFVRHGGSWYISPGW